MPTSYLQMREIRTVNKARVLKCRAAAHLMGFFIPSYACTLHKIWSRQGKLTITIPQASFIPIFMRPIQRNQTSTSFCEILEGRPLGITPGKERAKERERYVEDTGPAENSPLFP